jgi:ABC-2 type transport system ATP-binding protein
MRCIAALDRPTAGTITVAGLDTVADPRGVHAAIGYLPDFFGLYDELSVLRALVYAARSRGVAVEAADEAARRAAERVELSDRLEKRAGELSRGLRQRLAIAQTIVHRPEVLLLDEPAAGLDPQARRDLSRLLVSLKDDGMTLLVSSHILSELEDYSTRMIVIDHGKVAGGTAVALRRQDQGPLRIGLAAAHDGLGVFLEGAAGVTVIAATGSDALVTLAGGAEARARLLAALLAAGFAVSDFAPAGGGLEDVYFSRLGPRP